jgi:hypothetical protein
MSAKPSISLTEGVGIAVKNERQSCQEIKSGLPRTPVRTVENEKKTSLSMQDRSVKNAWKTELLRRNPSRRKIKLSR